MRPHGPVHLLRGSEIPAALEQRLQKCEQIQGMWTWVGSEVDQSMPPQNMPLWPISTHNVERKAGGKPLPHLPKSRTGISLCEGAHAHPRRSTLIAGDRKSA